MDLAGAYQVVQPALVFIRSGNAHGTGVVVSSNGSQSVILTSNHVVTSGSHATVYFGQDGNVHVEGEIVKRDDENDLAVLIVRRGNVPTVRIADTPGEGTAIGAAGFPASSIAYFNDSRELKAVISAGIVTAVHESGTRIYHSAQTEAGDSGGPVFLVDTGEVIGIVKGKLRAPQVGYVAIGAPSIKAFLQSSNVSFDGGIPRLAAAPQTARGAGPANPYVLQDLPSAYRFCLITNHSGTYTMPQGQANNGNLDYGTPVEAALAAKLRDLLKSDLVNAGGDPSNGTVLNPQQLVQIARSGNCIGTIRLMERWQVSNGGFISEIGAGARIDVYDYRGMSWFSEEKTKSQRRVFNFLPDTVTSTMADLGNQAFDAIAKDLSAGDGSAATNFARYGLAMVSGTKKSFFALAPGVTGASVAFAPAFGSAAQAGLQPGDAVVSVNGTNVAGLDKTKLNALVEGATDYDLVVRGADGRDLHVRFQPQDIRWYLQHAVTKS